MRWFFLSGDSIVKMLLVTLVVINILPWYISSLWVLIFIFLLILFRKNKAFYKDNFAINPDLMLSPVTGRVLSVQKFEDESAQECVVLRVSVPLFGPFGLFLPFDGGVEKLDFHEGRSLWRWRKVAWFTNELNRHNLTLRSKGGEKVELELLKGKLGFQPRLYVEPGDKGKVLACFGFIPLGGSINIKLPAMAKVMVSGGDKLKAGETAIVGL